MSDFIRVQIKRIEVDKWLEGCKIHRDPGRAFVVEWVSRNAKWFREEWNSPKCLCRGCRRWDECGYQLRHNCGRFQKESTIICA